MTRPQTVGSRITSAETVERRSCDSCLAVRSGGSGQVHEPFLTRSAELVERVGTLPGGAGQSLRCNVNQSWLSIVIVALAAAQNPAALVYLFALWRRGHISGTGGAGHPCGGVLGITDGRLAFNVGALILGLSGSWVWIKASQNPFWSFTGRELAAFG